MAGQEKQGVRNIHLPKYIVKGYPEDDDSNENAIKAKHARIADMFLARPAAKDVKIDVTENSVQDVKMTRKQKKQKRKGKKYEEKGKGKEDKKEDKKLKKSNQNVTDVEEHNNKVPDIITVIEEGIDTNEASTISSCFDFIRNWYSKKKQPSRQNDVETTLNQRQASTLKQR